MDRPDSYAEVTTMPVAELMSHPVVCVTPGTALHDALLVMLRTGLRHLVVVDAERRCRGILADRAVTAAWAADPSALEWENVGALLDPRPAVVPADATAADVARLMLIDRVDAAAVIDRSGVPLGVVTGSDLVSLMANHVPLPEPSTDREAADPGDMTD
jgi:CBS domain-containing protein